MYGFILFTITEAWQLVEEVSVEVPWTLRTLSIGTCCPEAGEVIFTPIGLADGDEGDAIWAETKWYAENNGV